MRYHRSHCRRKRYFDSKMKQQKRKRVYLNSIILDSPSYMRPYMDSASWLYMDPNPVLHVATLSQSAVDYALSSRNLQRHHHNHHRSKPHRWSFGRRQVVSCDETLAAPVNLFIAAAMQDASENLPQHDQDISNTSMFKKVPWHINLHMLKIRQS